jgi:SOS response regulatory protein OraA/RecX
VIDQAFSEITINEEEMALEVARKQARKYTGETKFDFRRKMSAYLGRRGFPYDAINSVIEIIMKEIQIENSDADSTYHA